ncbi:MAG: lipopolysaccharide heptosyltransferase family protein [Spartobacteria bacterium]|nr:lipopolysaccharide heptosyltransferase family protein [Spartobacteria bacterium]
MGDVIHALPVASAIHRAWPLTRITWILDPRWSELLEANPTITKIHSFPRESFRGPSGLIRALRWYRGLRSLGADTVVDLQCLLRSGLMAYCSGARMVVGLGDAREGAGFFYSRSVPVRKDEHAVNRYLRVLAALGVPIPDALDWAIPRGLRPEALTTNDPYIVLHPFSRGEGKSLTFEAIGTFIQAFREKSVLPIVLAGAPKPLPDFGPGVVDLLGKTSLTELIGLLRGASYVVSVDSGPMHLAAALGVPLLSIHTWSDPRLVGPFSKNSHIWQGGQILDQNLQRVPLPERAFTISDAIATGHFVAKKTAAQQ